MSDKQNPRLDRDSLPPQEDEQNEVQNGSPPKSYYYDDATGYEIYEEQNEDDEQLE